MIPLPPKSTLFPYTTLFRSEIEHGGALIHTPFFGNVFRELTGGTSIIVFSDDRLPAGEPLTVPLWQDRKSTRLNSSHVEISYAVFCLKKKTQPKLHCLAFSC